MNESDWLLIFDCDGVLIDSEVISSRIELEELRRLGCTISLDRYLEVSLGRTEEEEIWKEIAALDSIELPSDFVRRVHEKVAAAFGEELEPIAGIKRVLEETGYRKCVASGSRMERLTSNLEQTGLVSYFERIFSAVEVERGKPFPDLFLYVSEELDISPNKCIVIEDSLAGVDAARQAGMRVLGFTGASHCRPGLRDALLGKGCDDVFDDMVCLPGLCSRLTDVV